MKRNLLLLSACCILASTVLRAQCGAGYTSAQLNWDMLDYYYNSGSNVQPYGHSSGNYITNAMEQTQGFAIGRNMVTFAVSASGVVDGENATHTGNIAGYDGEDAQFTPSANLQTITLTFANEVTNLNFTLYDVDLNQRIDFSAANALLLPQNINVVTYASSILTIANNNLPTARITANGTTLANNENRGSATITVAGPVKTFTLTITTIGTNAVFWMSDINACITGNFPVNYQQTGNNQPLQGPAGNQPNYFLVTPDNNSVYMVDAATGNATRVFQDASKQYVNSFAYDPYRRYLYYISENASVNSNNRELKRYDFNTGTTTVLVADITSTLGIPTMGSGVESAGAAFYDDALYLGIEGGRFGTGSSTRTRETIIWRIDFDASWNPTTAYQVFATDSYTNSTNTSIHDFGDFIIKDGVLYDFNTARNSSSYANSKYHHYDMTTGTHQSWNNPGTTIWNGQAGMAWDGTLFYFRNGSGSTGQVGIYNEDGTNGSAVNITVIDGTGAWPGGNGDASENFRPQVDFGDAPSSYDPDIASPAAHDLIPTLRLGNASDKEWVVRGQTVQANADNFDDGLPYVTTFSPDYDQYLVEVTVFNNTGSDATLGGWIDYDGNGIFEAHEGRTVTVPSSASPQQVYIYWAYIPSNLPFGSSTYLRLRITGAANGMTTDHATGWFNNGEVEDYRVPVDNFPLNTKLWSFDAFKNGSLVNLNWKTLNEEANTSYELQRSSSLTSGWNTIYKSTAATNSVSNIYNYADKKPLYGTSYYRVMVKNPSGIVSYSDTRKIDYHGNSSATLAPNPAISKARLTIYAEASVSGWVEIVNSQGATVYKQNTDVLRGDNQIELPVDKLAAGQYIVRFVSNTINLSKSLIVKK